MLNAHESAPAQAYMYRFIPADLYGYM